MQRALAAVGVLIALTVSPGCARGPSKEDFAKEADPVCRTGNAELEGVTRPVDLKQVGEVAGKVHASTQKQVVALRKLDQPSEEEATLKGTLAGMDTTRDAAKKIQDAAAGGDTRTVESGIGELRQAADNTDASAREYGLTQCGVRAKEVSSELDQASKEVLKKEFIAKADALCADTNRKLEAIPEPRDFKGAVRLLDESLALTDKLTADIKALHVPQAEQQAFNDVLGSQEKLIAKARELREAAAANDETRAERLAEELDPLESEANKKADAFGFKDCGSAA